ncbi:MAG: hypothetical protein K6C36_09425 [Clostridia bacterium]|nr:hypothetical protein [Clostridia bacterium]
MADEKTVKIHPDAFVSQSRIGDHSSVDKDSVVLSSRIGEYVDIEKRNLLRSAVIGDMTYTGSEVSIMWANVGKFCCIARQVNIGGNEHNYAAASMMPTYRVKNKLGGRILRHQDEEFITVGSDVWIGTGACVARKPGLTIGDGAVIGAGAIVTKSIPPYAIAVGSPARVIKMRFPDDIIAGLLELKWWDWDREKILSNWELLSCDMTEDVLSKLFECSQ